MKQTLTFIYETGPFIRIEIDDDKVLTSLMALIQSSRQIVEVVNNKYDVIALVNTVGLRGVVLEELKKDYQDNV